MCSANCIDLNNIDLNADKEIIKSIGKTLCNYEVYILDKFMKPVPIGVEGEIYIGGAGVGKGYLNNIELTNKKFIESPFKPLLKHSNKIYSTGDLGKWTEDGQIIYIGRSDFQVKINGQRIELSEIENTITLYPLIDHAIVINKKHEKTNSDYLICYYKSKMNESISELDLKRFILKKLPKFMCPNYFMKIEKIPLFSSGKINTKELPIIKISEMNVINYVPPETKTEKEICSILQYLFKINENEIGKTTDFIELGINSLNSIKFSYMIERRMNIKLEIKDILSHSTIQEISNYIDEIIKSNTHNSKNETIKKCGKEQFPLTSQQLGIYIDFIQNKNTTTYNIPVSMTLKDDINIKRLEYSIQKMFNRNKILKSKYLMNDTEMNNNKKNNKIYNNIYGIIDENAQLNIEHFSSDKINSFVRPFNLEVAPLFRVAIVDNSVLLLDIHHIIVDGTSISILIRQINEIYYGVEKTFTNEEVQYSDYAWFINEKKESKEYDEQFKFYKEMFSTMEYETPEIPMKTFKNNENNENEIILNSMNNKKGKIGTYQKNIKKELNERINNYLKENRISITSLFFSIYIYVLSKYSKQNNIYTSVINNNRNRLQCEEMIGMFVTTHPLLINIPSNDSFNKFINENMKTLLKVYEDELESFAGLTEKLNLKKLNNCFIYQPENTFKSKNENNIFKNNEYNIFYSPNDGESKVNNEQSLTFSKFDLFNIYDIDIIDKFVQSFEKVIDQIENFGNIINDIEYIPDNEKNRIIYEFNCDKYEYENVKCYHTEFEKVAKEKPKEIAIIYNDIKINYMKLDEMSNSLGHLLLMKNVERNDIIPIITDRSPSFIVSTLAISKAGGAFLPIDKNLPDDRILYILSEVSPKLILCTCNISEIDIKIRGKYNVYDVNQHDYNKNINQLNNINEIQDTCYVLFTSGTTGKPKGTILTHYNLYNYIKRYPMECNSLYSLMKTNSIRNVLGITNFSFDIYHNEITYSLCHGLTIVLVSQELSENIQELSQYIMKNSIDFINTTPTRFELFMENELFRKVISNVRAIIFIGEKLPYSLCKEIHKYSNSNIYNGYGPTECTVVCSYKHITDNNVTIGKPISNNFIYILDNKLKPVPIGVEGEIYIGGAGVGQGYINRKELTTEKFIKSPFY
ncbi:hypothetical protein PIROE2DRAFT_14186 [Piromyces sp. E2]|nr:hypothetical protein PIROE2DRAFT_14186 [Piromyces sp. E2]|eukprot:OUM60127.1 hypothetical protein PIROE2DRAFT_14186 [Piromyces sp. E2]